METIETLDVTAMARERGLMFGEKVQIVAMLLPDIDVTPDDYDCYSAEDKEAWSEERWQFVGVEVSVHVAGVLACQDSLWGVEYGQLAEVECDPLRDDHPLWVGGMVADSPGAERRPVPGMVGEALERAATNLREALAQFDAD